MKRFLLPVLALMSLFGCSKNESDLTATDRQKMDKLFTEGVKNTPDAKPGERGSEGTPMNAADK
jgi:hypothetical protein